MARPPKISPDEVARLRAEGLQADAIAQTLGVSRSGVYAVLRRLDMVRDYVSADLPWTIAPEHQRTGPYNYLRALSKAALTGGGDMRMLRTAFDWAKNILVQKKDISYDPAYTGTEVHPSGGFRLIDEPAEGGWLRKLYEAAERGPDSK